MSDKATTKGQVLFSTRNHNIVDMIEFNSQGSDEKKCHICLKEASRNNELLMKMKNNDDAVQFTGKKYVKCNSQMNECICSQNIESDTEHFPDNFSANEKISVSKVKSEEDYFDTISFSEILSKNLTKNNTENTSSYSNIGENENLEEPATTSESGNVESSKENFKKADIMSLNRSPPNVVHTISKEEISGSISEKAQMNSYGLQNLSIEKQTGRTDVVEGSSSNPHHHVGCATKDTSSGSTHLVASAIYNTSEDIQSTSKGRFASSADLQSSTNCNRRFQRLPDGRINEATNLGASTNSHRTEDVPSISIGKSYGSMDSETPVYTNKSDVEERTSKGNIFGATNFKASSNWSNTADISPKERSFKSNLKSSPSQFDGRTCETVPQPNSQCLRDPPSYVEALRSPQMHSTPYDHNSNNRSRTSFYVNPSSHISSVMNSCSEYESDFDSRYVAMPTVHTVMNSTNGSSRTSDNVILQETIMIGDEGFSSDPCSAYCKSCRLTVLTSTSPTYKSAAYLCCFLMFFSGVCCPLSFLPFAFCGARKVYHTCPQCHNVLGIYLDQD